MENQYLRNQILSRLEKIPEPAKFEATCEDYLKTFPEYECLYTKGRNAEGKIIRGMPDSLIYDFKTNSYIAFEYSTEENAKSKAIKSINGIAEFFKEQTSKCKRIVVCTNRELDAKDEIEIRENAEKAGMELDLHDIRRIISGIIDLPNLLYKHFAIEPQIKYFELLDKRIKSRRVFPKLEDFENELVFIDKNKADDVCKIIENKNMCLIYGKPAAGKTVFSFVLGKILSDTYLVYHYSIKGEFDSEKLMHEIIINDSSQILYIIDDCHRFPERVYKLIEHIETNNIKSRILYISRNIKSSLGEEENYFRVLKDCSILIKADKTIFKNIIDLYEDYKSRGITDYIKKEYDLDLIIDKCGLDLFILSCLLDAWNLVETERSLDEVKEYEILNRISSKYLEPYDRKIERNELLVSLSALYQFDFPIESSFFYSKIKNIPEDTRNDILNEGLIEVQEGENESLYFLPHSTFAILILKTVEKKRKELLKGKSAYDYTKEICLEYLETKPKYVLNIVRLLFNNGRKDIAKEYCENGYFAEKINKHFSKAHFTTSEKWLEFLESLKIGESSKEKILDDEVIREIAKKLKDDISFQSFVWFLKRLVEFNKLKAKKLFESLDKEVVSARLKDEKLINIQKFFERGAEVEVSQEDIRKILEGIINESCLLKENFLLKIEESNLINFEMLLRNLKRIDKSSSLNGYLVEKLTAEKLSQVYKKKKVSVRNIERIFAYTNKDFVRSFIDLFDEKFLIQSYNYAALSQIGKFIFHYSNYNPVYLSAYEKFGRTYLREKLQDSPINNIDKFIFRIGKTKSIGEKLAKDAINELKKIDIAKNIENGGFNYDTNTFEPTKLNDISWLIRTVKSFDNADFIIHQLRHANLIQQIEYAELETIAHFLWSVFEVDDALARKYCEIVYKSDLVGKAKESTHDIINFFCWNVYQIDEGVPIVFVNNEIRKILVEKSKVGDFIDSIKTVGIFEAVECSILSEMPELDVIENSLVDCLENCLKHPFQFIWMVKGLKTIDEDMFSRIFHDTPELGNKTMDLLKSLAEFEITSKTKKLLNELLDFVKRIMSDLN